MRWEVAAGAVLLGTPADGLGEPMSPTVAASKVDEWFPRYDPHLVPKLQEMVRAAGGIVLRNDGDELRELVKRALRDGKLVAAARVQSLPTPTIRRRDPPPRPYSPQPLVREKEALRFCLRNADTSEPVVGAKVVIQYEDGRREEMHTDASGEIFFSAKTPTKFTLVEIDEPFVVSSIGEQHG